jgi:hypothetical protein
MTVSGPLRVEAPGGGKAVVISGRRLIVESWG